MGCANQAEVLQPAATKGELEDVVWVSVLRTTEASGKNLMHVVDWAKAQHEDPIISKIINWLKPPQETSLKHTLGPQQKLLREGLLSADKGIL